jgi:hypothetical protein
MQRIIAFPQDQDTWRIDWHGDVLYQRHYRYLQPFIRIALSRVTLNPTGSWDYPKATNRFSEQVQAIVPIGMLGLLPIGSIWQDGQLVANPSYTEKTFTVISRQDSSQIIKAGTESGDGQFMLPFEVHPFHRAHTHSYCLRATQDDESKVIIPASELIRFYFGSSSGLLGRLFTAPFQEQRLWLRAEKDEHGDAAIELAEGVSGASAADIARIAFDPGALHAAKVISGSLLSATSSDNKTYPRAQLPFSGKSELRVRGVWLDEGSQKSFLVFQILSCSHRFPFLKLKYSMTQRKSASGEGDASRDGKSTPGRKSGSQGNALVNDPPDRQKQPRRLGYLSASKFPDLDYKQVSRGDQMAQVRMIVTDSGEIAVASAVGEGEGRTGIRPVDLVAAEAVPIPKGHPLEGSEFAKYVDEVVQELLKQRKRVWFVPLSSRQRFPQFSVMPQIVNADGEIHPFSYIEIKEKVRPRYISVIRVQEFESVVSTILFGLEGIVGLKKGGDALMRFPLQNEHEVNAVWVANSLQKMATWE